MSMHGSLEIREMLEQAHVSDQITAYLVRTGEDSTGDPAVKIWVILNDEAGESPDFGAETADISEQVVAVLRDQHVDLWPYVRFRTRSEQDEIDADCRPGIRGLAGSAARGRL